MGAGLKILLDEIAKATLDQPTLIARYISLLTEMPDDQPKALCALELVDVIREADPKEALRLAHIVYSFDPGNTRALLLMIDILEKQGKLAKAEVLRNELSRLQTPPAVPDDVPDDPGRRLVVRLPQMEESNLVRPAVEDVAFDTGIIPPEMVIPVPELSVEEPVSLPIPEFSIGVMPEPDLSVRDEAYKVVGNPTEYNIEMFKTTLSRPAVLESTVPPVVFSPEPVPTGSPSGAASTAIDHFLAQGFLREARMMLEASRAVSCRESWWVDRQRRLEASEGSVDALSLKSSVFETSSATPVVMSDAETWGRHLDTLIASGDALAAWWEIRDRIVPSSRFPWARQVMGRLHSIRSVLRGSPVGPPDFDWIEEEGVAVLVQKLNERKPYADVVHIVS